MASGEFVGGGRLCPPAEKSDFTENYGEYVTSQGRTESSAPTKRYEDALGETKLFDEKKCLACENKYGKITERVVIYQGESYIAENGVQYINAEEYLKAL